MKKYELLGREINGLCRIRALRDFADVKKGDIGGHISKEENLSHEGDCWVYPNAVVHGDAEVRDDAWLRGDVVICNRVKVTDNACIDGRARISGDAWIKDNAMVFGNATIFGNAWICDNAMVYGHAMVSDDARIYGRSKVYGESQVGGEAKVYGDSRVYGEAWVYGDTRVYGDQHIISKIHEQYTEILGVQTLNRLITIYKDLNGVQKCNIGCQLGMTLEQLEQRIDNDGGMKPHRKVYLNLMKSIKL